MGALPVGASLGQIMKYHLTSTPRNICLCITLGFSSTSCCFLLPRAYHSTLELFHVWRMYPLLMFPASTTVFLWDSAYVEELTSRFKQRQNMFKGEMFWMEVFFSKSKIWVDEWLLMWLSPRLTHFWVLLTHVSKSEKNFMSFSAVH